MHTLQEAIVSETYYFSPKRVTTLEMAVETSLFGLEIKSVSSPEKLTEEPVR